MVKTTEGSHGEDKPAEVNKANANVEKIVASAISKKARDYPNFPASETGGAMPMSIQSRFVYERQRLGGDFTDKWRKWRAQWIKDQTLHPAEPLHVEALEKEFYNPIRRAMRAPLNWVERQLYPILGGVKANKVRRTIGICFGIYSVTFWVYYYLKYHPRTWEDSNNTFVPMIFASREAVYPNDPAYPSVGYKFKKEEFGDLGFSKRKALLFNPNESTA